MKTATLVAILVLSACSLGAQQPSSSSTPVIWRDPGNVEAKDLFVGNTSPDRQPQAPFTFVREKLTGATPKIVVKDARGVEWDVKLAGEEAHGEVVASRLLWALGYPVQELYFLGSVHVEGVHDLSARAAKVMPNGTFGAGRLRRRDDNLNELSGWAFDANPFAKTKELSGLIIAMALINNWDTEGAKNQEVVEVKLPNGATETWYSATDLGASFGRFDGPKGTPIKWSVPDYQKDSLVQKVEGDTLVLNYRAYGTPITRVPLDHARWFAGLVGRLSDVQIRAAFKAGAATDAETDAFARKLEAKIAELKNAVGGGTR